MNFNNIRNLGEPKNVSDGATRGFVEESITKGIKRETRHLITASASYHADLIKGDYQFTFGGSSMPSYKKHDVFNGFLVPHSGYIKKFVVLDTGIKLNFLNDDDDLLTKIVVRIGLDVPIPLFTLVLIKHNEKPIDIGTLYFMFTKYVEIGVESGAKVKREYVYKSKQPSNDKENLAYVKAKDIINIRSEFNSVLLGNYRTFITDRNYNIVNSSTEFFMHLVSILIELDPLI